MLQRPPHPLKANVSGKFKLLLKHSSIIIIIPNILWLPVHSSGSINHPKQVVGLIKHHSNFSESSVDVQYSATPKCH